MDSSPRNKKKHTWPASTPAPPGAGICHSCQEPLTGKPAAQNPFKCPYCGSNAILVILPQYAGVEEFSPSRHTDPELRLTCHDCFWLGTLGKLQQLLIR